MIKHDPNEEKELRRKLHHYLMGDEAAVNYCLSIVTIAHTWDDIVDGGKPSFAEVCGAFRIALFDIPNNAFYNQFKLHLLPVMMNAILAWQDSNILDHGSEHDQHIAYVLRASIIEIIAYCALLVGGPEWAIKVGPDIRRLYEEPLEKYMEEMKNA